MKPDGLIQLGISTCPNDTFAFHALLNQRIDTGDLEFEIQLLDVQQLNDRLLAGHLDVAKASFHAALMLAADMLVLPSGSALGFGNGPLLLSRQAGANPLDVGDATGQPVVLCPGATTTATLLFQLFYDVPCQLRQVVFSEIMPALLAGNADFGVCIHEGRFTWQQQGLHCVADLGAIWQQRTQLALPLGGILARRALGSETIARVQDLVRQSIEFGLANREDTLPTMRRYAAEFDDEVLLAHVDLYVNEHTLDLGTGGRQALAKLSELAMGLNAAEAKGWQALEVFDPSRSA